MSAPPGTLKDDSSVRPSRDVGVMPAQGAAWPLALATAIAGLVELAVGIAIVRSGPGIGLLLVLHAATLAAMYAAARLLIRASGADTTDATIAIAATAALGPLGALVAAVSILVPSRRQAPERLAEWYERIALATPNDPVTRLSEQIAAGRVQNLAAPAPPPLMQLMSHGTIGQRQAALGLIGRAFHPDYLPVLNAALRSPEPIIRVQAAAVAARLQPSLPAWLGFGEVPTASSADETRAEAVRAARMVLASGMIDEGAARRGRQRLASFVSKSREGPAGAEMPVRMPASLTRVRAREDLLIAASRLRELRELRRGYRRIGDRACAIRRPLRSRFAESSRAPPSHSEASA